MDEKEKVKVSLWSTHIGVLYQFNKLPMEFNVTSANEGHNIIGGIWCFRWIIGSYPNSKKNWEWIHPTSVVSILYRKEYKFKLSKNKYEFLDAGHRILEWNHW